MIIKVQRFISNQDETIGILLIDGVPVAVTCEDQKQAFKIKGETRIPEGTYKIGLRKEGGHHAQYLKKYPKLHQGMLELQNVKDFQFILIHIGNTDKDTEGCILVGEKFFIDPSDKKLKIENSTLAYERVYKTIIDEIAKGKEVSITIENIEKK